MDFIVMMSPRVSSKPTAEATDSRQSLDFGICPWFSGLLAFGGYVDDWLTRTATVTRLIAPAARTTARSVSETS